MVRAWLHCRILDDASFRTFLVRLSLLPLVILYAGNLGGARFIALGGIPQNGSNQPHSAFQLPEILACELREICINAPPELSARLWQSVSESYKTLCYDEVQLQKAINRLRYMNRENLFLKHPMNADVSSQVQRLADDIPEYLQSGKLGEVPLSNLELTGVCRDYTLSPYSEEHLPYFRATLPKEAEEAIRARLRARLDELSALSKLLWMNDEEVNLDDRKLLWRCFCQQVVSQLVIEPIVNHVDAEIAASFPHAARDLTLVEKDDFAGGELPTPRAARDTVQSELDNIALSHERIYGLVLSCLPLVVDASNSDSSQINELIAVGREEGDAKSCFDIRFTFGLNASWFCLAFGHISVDGTLHAEQRYASKCFLYNRHDCSLSEYDRVTNRLVRLGKKEGQKFSGSAYFLKDYKHSDLLSALNCLNSVSRAYQELHTAKQSNGSIASATLHDLTEVFGQRCADVPALQAMQRQLGLHSSHQAAGVSHLVIPRIGAAFHVAPSSNARCEQTLRLDYSLFPNNVRIEWMPAELGSIREIRLLSPGCIEIDTSSVRTATPRSRSAPAISAGIGIAQQVVESARLIRLSDLLGGIISDRGARSVQGLEGDLLLIRTLTEDASFFGIPRDMLAYSQDVQIGILSSLGRRDELVAMLSAQSELMRSCNDRNFVEAYFRYYQQILLTSSNALNEGGVSHCAPIRCFKNHVAEAAREDTASVPPEKAVAEAAAALQNVMERSQVSADVDLAGQLGSVLKQRLTDDGVAAFAAGHLGNIWTRFPLWRMSDEEVARLLNAHWQSVCDAVEQTPETSARADLIVTATWQTYHCLRLRNMPLTDQQLRLHASQTAELRSFLTECDDLLAAEGVPQYMLVMANEEMAKSTSRLSYYFASPLLPMMAWPLERAQFDVCLNNARQARVERLAILMSEYESKRNAELRVAVQLAKLRSPDVDFFQNNLRQWASTQSRIFVAHSVGEIVRYYGLMQRDYDYGDSATFPFTDARGLSLNYRMVEGISVSLATNWTISDITDH